MKNEGEIKKSDVSRMLFANAMMLAPFIFHQRPLLTINDGSPNIRTYGSRAYKTYSPDKWKDREAGQGRNEPCNCGSGVKYKKCCLQNSTSGE